MSATTPKPLSYKQERSWASFVHLTYLFNLVTLIGGVIGALIIYLVFRKRSSFVAFHALQSLFLQLFLWVLGWSLAIAAWIGSNAASQRLAFGFCLLPFAFLINLLPIIGAGYAMFGSMEIRRVGDFHYYRVSDWALAIIDRPEK